jgi:hypothetical protein
VRLQVAEVAVVVVCKHVGSWCPGLPALKKKLHDISSGLLLQQRGVLESPELKLCTSLVFNTAAPCFSVLVLFSLCLTGVVCCGCYTDLSRIVGFEVEAFSVQHTYEGTWDPKDPVLNTCHPGRSVPVSHTQRPQQVQEGAEVIFSYDVKYTVSGLLSLSALMTALRSTPCGIADWAVLDVGLACRHRP